MITLILSAQVTPTRPHAEAMTHLKSVHGPMVYDAPDDVGPMPSIYVQNHVLPGLILPSILADWAWDRDLVTEISFDDLAHLKAATTTPYYLKTMRSDEGSFVDQTTVRPLIVSVEPVGTADAEATTKLFVYLKAGPDLAIFEARWRATVDAASSFAVSQAMNRPLRQQGTPPVFVDGIWSLWFDDRDQAETFCRTHLEPLLDEFGDALDPGSGHVVLAEEYSVARLRIENATPSQQRLSA